MGRREEERSYEVRGGRAKKGVEMVGMVERCGGARDVG